MKRKLLIRFYSKVKEKVVFTYIENGSKCLTTLLRVKRNFIIEHLQRYGMS